MNRNDDLDFELISPSSSLKIEIPNGESRFINSLSKKRSASDYRLWLRINNKYKPKIILKNLTNAMMAENTISGTFEFERYIFQAKQMIKFSDVKKKLLVR